MNVNQGDEVIRLLMAGQVPEAQRIMTQHRLPWDKGIVFDIMDKGLYEGFKSLQSNAESNNSWLPLVENIAAAQQQYPQYPWLQTLFSNERFFSRISVSYELREAVLKLIDELAADNLVEPVLLQTIIQTILQHRGRNTPLVSMIAPILISVTRERGHAAASALYDAVEGRINKELKDELGAELAGRHMLAKSTVLANASHPGLRLLF